ncbi:MAG TPA: molybdopterin-synthase adenylyltransferase MoeB [Opitutaceae bacterium]
MALVSGLTSEETARYSRHIILPEIGLAGQARLKQASVLVVGAGGLGCPAALYLAAAGVGTIGLADFDKVEAHNLQRQVLHATADVGRPKTESGARHLHALNPNVRIVQHTEGVRPENAVELFARYDLIVDGSDNFPTRYLNTDAAFFAKRPLVYGSIFKFEGQVTVFDPHSGGPCYRCLFPEPPPPGSVPNCGEAGVLGALCGVIGSLQAMEAIKRLSGITDGLVGRLLVIDALTMSFRSLNVRKDPECPVCGGHASIRSIEPDRYAGGCAVDPVGSRVEQTTPDDTDEDFEQSPAPLEMEVHAAANLFKRRRARLLDVREPFELNICQIDGATHIPMRQIPQHIGNLPTDEPMLVFCHHGGRSRQVTQFLRAQGFEHVSNIRGGIDAWAREIAPEMQRY